MMSNTEAATEGRATASVPPVTGWGTTMGTQRSTSGRGKILTTRVGLRIPDDLPFESWQRAGLQISRIVDSFAWCLGDWLVYGQRRYTDRYRRAVDAVGLDYQTLRNYASVARRVDINSRRSRLSFQHHAEVAALPPTEQDRWLARAEAASWSRNQLRQHLRASRGQDPGTEIVTTSMPRMYVPLTRVERWREAAARRSQEFENWIVTVLDHAAEEELADDRRATPIGV